MSASVKLNGHPQRAISTEMATAQGLRASHDITSVLEKSKSSAEQILDQLPDLFVIMDKEGRILKGNLEAARLLRTDVELLLNRNLYDVFPAESKNVFGSRVTVVLRDHAVKHLEFELSVFDEEGKAVEYLWTVSRFTQISDRRGPLLKIMGKDISKLKEFQKKLSQIFSAIPLGIFTVNALGEIEWPYSLYSEFLLGDMDLVGKNLHEALFQPTWDSLDPIEKTGAMQVVGCIGGDTMWFDLAKLHFPKEIKFTRQTEAGSKEIWLGIAYHPVTQDNLVQKLLVVLEDRTEVVRSRQDLDVQRQVENSRIKRILEIQACPSQLLEASFTDFDQLFPRLGREVEAFDLQKIPRTLHAIKGVARTAGFSELEREVHALEETVLGAQNDPATLSQFWLIDTYERMKTIWSEIKSMVFALSGKHHALPMGHEELSDIVRDIESLRHGLSADQQLIVDRVIGKIGGGMSQEAVRKLLSTLEPKLLHQKEVTSRTLGKQVDLSFDWSGIELFQEDLVSFGEIFLHLLNNAIDHGIESPDDRLEKGKTAEGHISFLCRESEGILRIEISDDGRGVSREGVIQAAIRKEILDPVEALNLEDADVYDILLRPGFSSRENATTISGRGIGLDSVNEAVKSLGGAKLEIHSEEGRGTVFWFEVPSKLRSQS